MNKPVLIGLLVLLGIGAFVAFNALFTVYPTQQALVLQFGDPRKVIKEAGLQYKVPFIQNVIYLDKRILDLDMPAQEVIAADQKRLVVDAFARFKISDPLRFYQSVTNEAAARSRLATILNSALRRVLGESSFVAVVRDERPELMKKITDQVNTEAAKLGIEIVDVKIRRADLPQANSEAIFRRMQTERQREASEFRAQGQEQSQRIRSRADREVTILKAEASRDAEKLRGEGDAERNRIFAEAYGQNPDFFAFYRSMQAYENSLRGEDTTLVLTPDSDFFRYFGGAKGGMPGSGTTRGTVRTPDDGTGANQPPANPNGAQSGVAPATESEPAISEPADVARDAAPAESGTATTAEPQGSTAAPVATQ